MQEIVHNDVVYIIPYYPQKAQAYRTDRFTGWLDDQPRLALEDLSSLARITPVQRGRGSNKRYNIRIYKVYFIFT